jgi:hypothetical protein
MAGYGRGYYGEAQLAKEPPRRKRWFTVVAVLGVGAAVVWLWWPRKTVPGYVPISYEPAPTHAPPNPATYAQYTPAQLPPVQFAPVQFAPAQLAPAPAPLALPPAPPTGAFLKQLEDDAHARHFLTVKDYEDSVVKSAKQLQTAGATVVLAPHLQHLAPQLEPRP